MGSQLLRKPRALSCTLGSQIHHSVACIAGKGAKGEPVWLTFHVLDGDGAAVPDAMIELWQADAAGEYGSREATFRGFGRLATAEDGSCTFETIKPGRVPGPGDTFQAPHINLSVFARGLLKRLSTRVYFAGEVGERRGSYIGVSAGNAAGDSVRSARSGESRRLDI